MRTWEGGVWELEKASLSQTGRQAVWQEAVCFTLGACGWSTCPRGWGTCRGPGRGRPASLLCRPESRLTSAPRTRTRMRTAAR